MMKLMHDVVVVVVVVLQKGSKVQYGNYVGQKVARNRLVAA